MAKHWDFDTRFPSGNADVRHLLKDGKPRRGSTADSKSADLLNSDDEPEVTADGVLPDGLDPEGSGS